MSISNEQAVAFIKKNPIMCGCFVTAVALVGALYFRSDKLAAAELLLEEKSGQGQRLATNVKYAAHLPEQLEAISAANKAIEGRLVRASQLAANSQYFYKLEAETGTKLIELNPIPVPPAKDAKSNFVSVGYSVGVQGTFAQVLDFLRRLESGVHFARVASTTLSPAAANEGAADLLTVRLSVEFLGAP